MKLVHQLRLSLRLTGCTIALMAAGACAAQTSDSNTQNPGPSNAQNPGASKVAPNGAKPDKPQADRSIDVRLRRLESVTWNPVTQELTWVLSTGDLNNNGYTATKQESYVIHMDAATMTVKGEDRHFDADEAEQVGKVMDLICRYALESTLWWEHGGGKTPTPAPGTKTDEQAPTDPANKNKSRAIPPGMLRGAVPPPAGMLQSTAAVAGLERR